MKVKNSTTHLKLPMKFDVMKLNKDLSILMDSKWIPHFNTNGYSGEWKVVPLYSSDGSVESIFANSPESTEMVETSALKECPYLKEVINSFKCRILTARILRLGVGAQIKPHRDHELGYENNNFRLHIPIVTNDKVKFILDDELLTMLPGECWYTNVNYVHSVANNGDSDRVHLVIDCERNEWSDQLFFSLAPETSFQPEPREEDSPEVLQRIIGELKSQNQSHMEPFIKDMEAKLAVILNSLHKSC